MKELAWLDCKDPARMLPHLKHASGRQLAHIAVACCRWDRTLMKNSVSRRCIEWLERIVAGTAHIDDQDGPSDADCYQMASAANHAMAVVAQVQLGHRDEALRFLPWILEDTVASASVLASSTAAAIRDIFGNPFRPTTIDPSLLAWRDATIPKLAQAAYDERELSSGHLDAKRLAILADALEESGCANEDVLAHLRGPGPHVRGCWVVDLLLGKE